MKRYGPDQQNVVDVSLVQYYMQGAKERRSETLEHGPVRGAGAGVLLPCGRAANFSGAYFSVAWRHHPPERAHCSLVGGPRISLVLGAIISASGRAGGSLCCGHCRKRREGAVAVVKGGKGTLSSWQPMRLYCCHCFYHIMIIRLYYYYYRRYQSKQGGGCRGGDPGRRC